MLQSTFLSSEKFYLWQQQRGNSAKILMQHWLLLTCRGCMHCPSALMTYSHTFLQFEKVEHNAVFIWSGHCASIVPLGNSCINILLLKHFHYQAFSASTLLEGDELGTHFSSNSSLKLPRSTVEMQCLRQTLGLVSYTLSNHGSAYNQGSFRDTGMPFQGCWWNCMPDF